MRPLRTLREDGWYHACNRGLAKRSIFESRADMRRFLAAIAWATRRYGIELHAFVIMLTHYHLLLRDPNKNLSLALQWAQSRYVRRFNWSKNRDGTLFRGRFWSAEIASESYLRNCVCYLHGNPVAAGIVPDARDYDYSSARFYGRGVGPRWLRMDALLSRGFASEQPCTPDQRWMMERSAFSNVTRTPALDDLVGATPGAVRNYMQERAQLADGTGAGLPVVGPEAMRAALLTEERCMAAGLWRIGCGLSHSEIASHLSTTPSTVQRLLTAFRARFSSEPTFADRAATLLGHLL